MGLHLIGGDFGIGRIEMDSKIGADQRSHRLVCVAPGVGADLPVTNQATLILRVAEAFV
jgi:hypothetical protein